METCNEEGQWDFGHLFILLPELFGISIRVVKLTMFPNSPTGRRADAQNSASHCIIAKENDKYSPEHL